MLISLFWSPTTLGWSVTCLLPASWCISNHLGWKFLLLSLSFHSTLSNSVVWPLYFSAVTVNIVRSEFLGAQCDWAQLSSACMADCNATKIVNSCFCVNEISSQPTYRLDILMILSVHIFSLNLTAVWNLVAVPVDRVKKCMWSIAGNSAPETLSD